jgi:hypothetical protein
MRRARYGAGDLRVSWCDALGEPRRGGLPAWDFRVHVPHGTAAIKKYLFGGRFAGNACLLLPRS